MTMDFSRMPRYDVRNDGAGPYAIFYCDQCGREFRSQPDVGNTLTQDIGRSTVGGFLRKVPLFGNAAADNLLGEDPRYSYKMNDAQLKAAWAGAQQHFRECPTCSRIVCLSDFDTQSGFCQEDSPRTSQIAEARGEQAGAAIKGLASAFGLGSAFEGAGKAVKQAAENAERASKQLARCPTDGTLAAAGTKFCPECGTAMVQPVAEKCPQCGVETFGAKFCPSCGAKQEAAAPAGMCKQCGAETGGVKFCPNCGSKQ
jgi:rRNA maturation protein Nop10